MFEQINVLPVWQQDIFGTGVRVRINDDGIDGSVTELMGRLDLDASCENAEPLDLGSTHGTAVASILGAAGNNGDCAVGIAPEVVISSCNVFATQETQTFSAFDFNLEQFDISLNSIGVEACTDADSEAIVRRLIQRKRALQNDNCPFVLDGASPCEVCNFTSTETRSVQCENTIVEYCDRNFEMEQLACIDFLDLIIGGTCEYNKVPDSMLEAIGEGILEGRGGKGIIYVFASGNSFREGDDVNFGGLTNSRLTITVGAVGKNGLHASYSSSGAAVFVSAPGGDDETISNHVIAEVGGGCDGSAVGTSFAAPVVAGVIALILEVNPDLSWRDVQGILAQTSRTISIDAADESLTTNGAGYTHSNLYGFGIVDAGAAVEAASNWILYCPEQFMVGESGLINATVLDDATFPLTHGIRLEGESVEDFITESVVVLLSLRHFSRGDLEVTLTSPTGTVSILHPGNRPENTQLDEDERWKLMTVRNWGEIAAGTWSLSIRDISSGDIANCIDSSFWTIFNDTQVDCNYLITEGICRDGMVDSEILGNGAYDELLSIEVDGFKLEESCCACGGGFTTDDFDDELIQWRLVIYGRNSECINTTTLTPDPNEGNETSFPSEPQNISSSFPSSEPSSAPTTRSPASTSTRAPSPPSTQTDSSEKIATIVATVVAFVLVLLCVWMALHSSNSAKRFNTESKQWENNAFSPINGVHA